jgi:hypothetical protein
VVKAKDKGIVNIFIDYKVGKDVVNNGEEVFNMFNDSRDKDY